MTPSTLAGSTWWWMAVTAVQIPLWEWYLSLTRRQPIHPKPKVTPILILCPNKPSFVNDEKKCCKMQSSHFIVHVVINSAF